MTLLKNEIQELPRTQWLIAWFAACVVSANLGFGLALYILGVVGCTLRSAKRPTQSLWLVFLSLATSVSSIPYAYHNTGWGGAAPEPYWYWGISIALPAMGALVGFNLWLARHGRRSRQRVIPRAAKAFSLAVIVASIYGLARGNGLGIVLRQGSGFCFLFLFTCLGYRLAPPPSRMLDVFRQVRKVLVAYGVTYIVYYAYLNFLFVRDLPDAVFLREPAPPLFFCGLFASLSLGELMFFNNEGDYHSGLWIDMSVLAVATIFSGSRASVTCMVLTAFFLLILKFVRHPLRLCLPLGALALLMAWGSPQRSVNSLVQASPFLQHIAGRFVVAPEGDFSFLERASQLLSVWNVFRARPILGEGLGASLVWFDPASLTWVQTAFVDNGFGYLLLKMGLVGTGAFFWLLGFVFKQTWGLWASTRLAVFLVILGSLVYYTAFLPFEPTFFEFLFCFWIAVLTGYILRTKRSRPILRTTLSEIPQTS